MELISAFFHNPTLVVGLSFVLFIGLVLKFGVPAMIGKALDARAEKIAKQLDEARTLKEEAKALLAQYQRKQRDVEQETQDMIAQSKTESENFAKEAEKSLEALIERQSKSAEEKIAQAELSAIKEVKGAAVNIAIGAAQKILAENLSDENSQTLMQGAIKDLDKQIH